MDLQQVREEMARLAGRLSHRHGFVCFPTADKVPCVKGWQQLTKSYFDDNWSRAKGVGIQTGQTSGITIVDIDKPDVPFYEKFVKHFNIPETTTVVTPGGGYHLYYLYNPELPQGNFSPLAWDIRNDGGYIMAPGSYYTNPKKPDQNWKKYTWAEKVGKKLDWDCICELPEEFLKLKHYGIDKETMKFGEKRLTFQSKESKAKEISDTNKKLFIDLMKAYSQNHNDYESWYKGVWSVAVVARDYYWDAEEVAVAWSSQIDNFGGAEEVRKKLKEFKKKKARGLGLGFILKQVSNEARSAFKKFKRRYSYHDYQTILKCTTKDVDMDIIRQYINSSFIRIDRMGTLTWFTKHKSGQWRTIMTPFKDEEINVRFSYTVDGKDIKTSLRQEIVKHKLDWVRNFEDFTFHPYYGEDEAPPDEIFNSFNGYRHTAMGNEYDEKDNDFQFVMNHWLEYMCNQNREYFNYLMDWLAWVIQKGHKKPRTAIVMFSKQGLGKGLMWTTLVWKGILGNDLAHSITDMETFTAKFNYGRLYKCLHIFNECTSIMSGERVNWDKMKSIVTDKEFRMEAKYKSAIMAEDCAGCVFLSNHEHCVKVEDDDRRYAVIQSNENIPDANYFTKLANLVESKRIQRMFFTYLVRRDISKFNFKDIPQTVARRECKEMAYRNNILLFLRQLVTGEYKPIKKGPEATMYNQSRFIFDWETNENILLPKQRWHSQHMLWLNYLEWLKLNFPRVKSIGKPTIIKQLKKDGLQISQRKCRTTSNVVICWRIDKDVVRNLYRTRLQDNSWDYYTS